MARNDDSQRGQGAPSRVYKASDVHKRRVDRKGRTKDEAKAPDAVAVSNPPVDVPESDAPVKSAVVITPEFGKKTQAQKEADDRWFAAMRGEEAPSQTQPFEKPPADSMGQTEATPAKALSDQLPEIANPQAEVSSGNQPATSDEQPMASDQQPIPSGQQSMVPDQQPTPTGQQPAAPDQQPTPSGQQPAAPDQQPEDSDQSEPVDRPSAHSPKSRKGKVVLVIIAVVLIAGIVAAAVFAWNRWYRFDDHADMQGQWYVVGTTVPVVIDESSIRLTDDVTYKYEINTQDKTIHYTFGPMEGQGRYWFSDDRQYLVITDGDEFTSTSTAFDDLMRMFQDLPDRVTGAEIKLPEGEGIIAFSREPDADALAKQQAEAEAKKKAEEAARKEAERKAAEEAAAAAAEAAAAEEYYEEEAAEGPAPEAAPEEPAGEDRPAEEEGGEA